METPSSTTPVLPSCTTAVPDTNGFVPPDACNANYGFYPSWEWNLVFAVAFGLTTAAHTIEMVRSKKWFCWVIVMGSLWECACFALRTLGARDQQNSTYVLVSTLLFLLAPLWINAFVYMCVARLARLFFPGERTLGLTPRWLAKVFVLVDIVSFVVQAGGGSTMAQADRDREMARTGQHIYMAGIGIQLFFVLVFCIAMFILVRRLTTSALGSRRAILTVWSLVAVLVLIVIRVVFRLIEFGGGAEQSNPILANEAYQLALDALPMVIALAIMNALHPGAVLQGESSYSKPKWRRNGADASDFAAIPSLSADEIELGSRREL